MTILAAKKIFSTLLLISSVVSFSSQPSFAQKSRDAYVFAPPSNIRESPGGRVICSVRQKINITVYGERMNGWYPTDVCGSWGYIHESQVKVIGSLSYYCSVVGIQTGQLALRKSPGGASIAGLNNNNVVEFLKNGNSPWVYVKVYQGPNNRVNGLKGWVNNNYLECAFD